MPSCSVPRCSSRWVKKSKQHLEIEKFGKIGCHYEGRRYQEGTPVPTQEPCLQCRCVESSLRCRLRICPRLPEPTPPGCRAKLLGEATCCPQLVCRGEKDENENTLKSVTSAISHSPRLEAGCLQDGVRYGPGSAMMGERRCEYCYCIAGERRCIRPKCLLPLPGCAPLYAPHSCCPVAYNCTRQVEASTTLAAISGNGCRTERRVYQEGEMVREAAWRAACDNCFCAMGAIRCVHLACAPPLQGCKPIVREGQCCPSTYNCSGTIEVKAAQNFASYAFISKDYAKFRKETNFYPAIQEVELSSAVEGRSHRVESEAAPEPISERLATTTTEAPSTLETEMINNEILAETTSYPRQTTDRETEVVGTEMDTTTRISGTAESTQTNLLPAFYLRDSSTTLEEDAWTEQQREVETTLASTTDTSEVTTASTMMTTIATSAEANTTTTAVMTTTTTTTSMPTRTTERKQEQTAESTTPLVASSSKASQNCVSSQGQDDDLGRPPEAEPRNPSHPTSGSSLHSTLTTSLPTTTAAVSTRAASSSGGLAAILISEKGLKGLARLPAGPSTSVLVPDDMLVMNVTVKTNVAVGLIGGATASPIDRVMPPDIETILNITDRVKGEDYEFDYSQPTLPPSLPNVRIIPFVAADALDKDKEGEGPVIPPPVTGYPANVVAAPPDLMERTEANFYDIVTQENRFSPPQKTEGGFVPRDPPYFDPLFHSSDLNLEIGTGVTVAPEALPIPNPHRKADKLPNNCLYEERDYGHGQVLPKRAICISCICYYGEIVCSNQKCPSLKVDCHRVKDTIDKCCSKLVCDGGMDSPTVVLDRLDSPTLVLDRLDAASPSHHVPALPSDPFRDVIKTEPAPDLPSLIGDMMLPPYYVDHGMTSARPSFYSALRNETKSADMSSVKPIAKPGLAEDSIFSLDRVLGLFFDEPGVLSSVDATIGTTEGPRRSTAGSTTTTTTTTTSPSTTTTTTTMTSPTAALPLTSISASTATTMRTAKPPAEKEPPPAGGLLKLAGCNIYGQMYRVGKVITELSGPCLECRCTELGVQCKQLDC